jgi:hypothetical protein
MIGASRNAATRPIAPYEFHTLERRDETPLGFWAEPKVVQFEVHYAPPAYPRACHPFTCRHEPQFYLLHNTEIVPRGRGGNKIELDHLVCMACGRALPGTIGGNVLVDLTMLIKRFGWHPGFAPRLYELRGRWSRIAARLFGPKGWSGRHEKIARLIDPRLTMKIRPAARSERGRRRRGHDWLGIMSFDPCYLREVAE